MRFPWWRCLVGDFLGLFQGLSAYFPGFLRARGARTIVGVFEVALFLGIFKETKEKKARDWGWNIGWSHANSRLSTQRNHWVKCFPYWRGVGTLGGVDLAWIS